jgi:hypothetical protein
VQTLIHILLPSVVETLRWAETPARSLIKFVKTFLVSEFNSEFESGRGLTPKKKNEDSVTNK